MDVRQDLGVGRQTRKTQQHLGYWSALYGFMVVNR